MTTTSPSARPNQGKNVPRPTLKLKQQTSPFFRLAAELRNRIYKEAFDCTIPIAHANIPPEQADNGIVLACKQTYTESIGLYYSTHTFQFSDSHGFSGMQAVERDWMPQSGHSLEARLAESCLRNLKLHSGLLSRPDVVAEAAIRSPTIVHKDARYTIVYTSTPEKTFQEHHEIVRQGEKPLRFNPNACGTREEHSPEGGICFLGPRADWQRYESWKENIGLDSSECVKHVEADATDESRFRGYTGREREAALDLEAVRAESEFIQLSISFGSGDFKVAILCPVFVNGKESYKVVYTSTPGETYDEHRVLFRKELLARARQCTHEPLSQYTARRFSQPVTEGT
ncbi:hypothetical protein Slin14017_G069360 [Septoria linicola]|nr:hypothetical protein Slin14017_G069360 [Septoria linicola]